MKHVFFFAGLLLASHLGLAQPLPAVSPPATLAAGPVAPDTVAALHRLYTAKRRRIFYVAGGTAAIGAAAIVLVGTSPKSSPGRSGSGYGTLTSGPLLDLTGFEQASAGIVTVALIGVEVLLYGKNTREAEQRAIAAYQAHQLPRHLTRQLKARYFLDLPR